MSHTKPRAVITGITGQDGAYLAALLLDKGYEVFGTYRRTSSVSFWRLNELEIKDHDNLYLVESDLTDLSSAIRLLQQAEPTEVYNLAAQSFVGVSFEQPITTADITGLGALNLLEAVRIVNPLIRFTKHPHLRCSVKSKRCPRPSAHLFTQEAHMAPPSYSLIGRQSITVKPTGSLLHQAFSLITSLHSEV